MTIREQLSDLISGGELTLAKRNAAFQLDQACGFAVEAHELTETLRAIAAEEKPTSNATVRRICRMAREAL